LIVEKKKRANPRDARGVRGEVVNLILE
jgi:hypothetical protein